MVCLIFAYGSDFYVFFESTLDHSRFNVSIWIGKMERNYGLIWIRSTCIKILLTLNN